jgi:hypothetical protein
MLFVDDIGSFELDQAEIPATVGMGLGSVQQS